MEIKCSKQVILAATLILAIGVAVALCVSSSGRLPINLEYGLPFVFMYDVMLTLLDAISYM